MNSRFHALSAIVATIAVAVAIAWGFVLVGSPGGRRLERVDEQRLSDLQTIVREIHSLMIDPMATTEKEKIMLKTTLPKSLEELAAAARDEKINLADPETGEPYTYTIKDKTTFESCAMFARPQKRIERYFGIIRPAGIAFHDRRPGSATELVERSVVNCRSTAQCRDARSSAATFPSDVELMVCDHLAELERAPIDAHISITYRGQPWTSNCREWVYFACWLDRPAIRARFALASCVIDHDHLGTHDGQEAGLVCATCNDAITGVHATHRSNLPTFP